MEEYALRVLLVDDQPIIGETVRRALAPAPNIDFRYCANPHDALETAERFKPTVILQDLVMPGVDGLTLLKQYRAHPSTSDVPIVVLSTKEEPRIKSEAFALGASDYLIKLPDPVELIARVRHHSKAYLNQLQRDAAYRERAAAQEQVLRLALQQQQLEEMVAQRLDSVGQLASGIAHEINTPMQYLSDNVQFIRESAQELLERIARLEAAAPGPVEEDEGLLYIKKHMPAAFESTLEGIERVSRIVYSLKDFARSDTKEMTACDINQAVRDTLTVAGSHYNRVADLATDFGDLPSVSCYGAQLHQALLNLVTNAADAIGAVFERTGEKGRLAVRTGCEQDTVVISISDTGGGIPEAIREKIFDPFFTTKDVGKGLGQGLTIARNIIVRGHGGTLSFQSEIGKGTTFTLRLPLGPADGQPLEH
jgi:two-component system NtrC family sensor kinase